MENLRALPYFAFAIGGTWLFWLIPVAAGWPIWNFPAVLFLYLGGACVPLAAVSLSWKYGRLMSMAKRLVDPRLIGPRWWLVILLFIPIVHVASGMLAMLFGLQTGLSFSSNASAMNLSEWLWFAGFILVLGPIPEEIGWRGYALPALLNTFGPAAATLFLGIAWCVWHVPLFLMTGYYEPFGGPPDPVMFFGNILIVSVVYTWVFLHTHGSVLAAVLLHFSVNFTGELIELSPGGELIKTSILACIAALLVGLGKVGRPVLQSR